MHEYSLIQSLVDRVEREARARNALAVHALKVRLGELSGVDPELFTTAYETFRQGTVCEKAELVVTRVPAKWVCKAGDKPIPAGEGLTCAGCGSPARLAEGDELFLDQIEMEAP